MVLQFSVPPLQQYDFFKVYSQEVKTEWKLNCNRALQRCRLNSRSATYICNEPPGHKKNFRYSLRVPHTYVKTAIAPPYLAIRGLTELPELNSSMPLLWLLQLLILIISLAEYFQFRRFFRTSGVPCCSSISSLFLLLVNKL